MSISTILAVLGIVVSLLFGAWGVYLAIVRRYQGELTFVVEQTIGLFDAIVRNLPEMAVLYKQTPVSPNVVLITGSLVNTGTKDISTSMIERPVSVALPQGSNWLSASVVSASPDVKASVRISEPGTIRLDNGLLRRNEFIRFQALAQLEDPPASSKKQAAVPLEERLMSSIRFDHRIEDTNTVKIFEIREAKRLGRTMGFYIAILVAGVVLCTALLVANAATGLWNKFVYDFRISDSEFTRVTVQRMLSNSIRVRSLDHKYSATMTVDEFFARYRNNPAVVRDRTEAAAMVGGTILIYVLLPSIVLGLRTKHYWKNKKLGRLLGLDRAKPAVTSQEPAT